jgi:hypothetical protein
MTADEATTHVEQVNAARREFIRFFTRDDLLKWPLELRIKAENLAWRMFLAGKGLV